VDALTDQYPSWSPYTYVLNSPLRLVDPRGLEPDFIAQASNLIWGRRGVTLTSERLSLDCCKEGPLSQQDIYDQSVGFKDHAKIRDRAEEVIREAMDFRETPDLVDPVEYGGDGKASQVDGLGDLSHAFFSWVKWEGIIPLEVKIVNAKDALGTGGDYARQLYVRIRMAQKLAAVAGAPMGVVAVATPGDVRIAEKIVANASMRNVAMVHFTVWGNPQGKQGYSDMTLRYQVLNPSVAFIHGYWLRRGKVGPFGIRRNK
jgi:hypothetical protein